MSISYEAAQEEFLNVLDEQQRKKRNSLIAYINGSYLYSNKNYKKAIIQLIYTIKYTKNYSLIFKSILKIVNSYRLSFFHLCYKYFI